MMLLRRLLFFMALFLSVACVCVVAGETGEQAERTCSDPLTVADDNGGCDPGKKGCKCENKPSEDLPECTEPEKEKCSNEDGGSEGECRKDTTPPCRPKEPEDNQTRNLVLLVL
ncbi:uncharacterized protein TM35_000451550 [Trypanosoma theileri]|uniref:Secreted protein n=1 Tax=Trypanosoma theileri TaxID=67003 RepID=A0A1X0NIE6_9TRYP|nr:uncharacterized protein TM35_000451550 [Trypanosoma theileri]ORC84417.1 hypothetical protein TM35_000451550 [Trypanosoma theileri]